MSSYELSRGLLLMIMVLSFWFGKNIKTNARVMLARKCSPQFAGEPAGFALHDQCFCAGHSATALRGR